MSIARQLLNDLDRDPSLAAKIASVLEDALNPDRRYTATQMAERLRANPKTVERWCREGRIPAAEKVGRVWMMPANVEVLPKAGLGPPRDLRSRRRPSADAAGQRALDKLKQDRRRTA